tara:strand:- start:39611 stop:39733 length:123 start_codon:yes stop_codon:yes gene_type:complete
LKERLAQELLAEKRLAQELLAKKQLAHAEQMPLGTPFKRV